MLLYFAISVLFLSIILIIYNWNENKTAIYLGGFLFLIAWYAVTHYFTSIANDPFLFAIFYGNFAFINLAAGPFIYFYVRGTIQDTGKLRPKDALHFIPLAINLAGLTPHIISPFSEKLALANKILSNLSTLPSYQIDVFMPIEVNFVMRPLLILLYASYSIYILINFKKRQPEIQSSPQYRITFRWLFAFLAVSFASTACYLYFVSGFINDDPTKALLKLNWATYVMTFTMFAFCAFLLNYPQILYGLPHFSSGNDEKSENVEFTLESDLEEKFRELAEQIKDYFDTTEPYLNPDFSLSNLAQELDVPQHHISYCFRFIFKQGFPKMKSEYRIAFAKKLLDSPEMNYLSFEGIGQVSGFSTRSSFYAAFQEIEGCSPGEYREKLVK